jgi:hypothetical protein
MRKVWLYKKADFNKINNEILEFQWEQFLHKCTDIEDMSNRFTHKYLAQEELFAGMLNHIINFISLRFIFLQRLIRLISPS